MKKFIGIFTRTFLVISFCMTAFVACSDSHSFSETWSGDENSHWHACTDEDCTEVADKADHVYDHACDPSCNVCGATRTIKAEETEDWYGNTTYKTKNVLSGTKGAQYVLKVPYEHYEIYVYIPDEENWQGDRWLVANYDVRIFDENFNELNVDFGEDGGSKLAYAYIVDENGKDDIDNWRGKNVYFMLTLKVAGEDFTIAMQ